jgi:AcrR family transcriptional regulator
MGTDALDATSAAGPGLRERKKARTRDAIVRATLDLTLEQGFAESTISQIARRADVAPRTVSLYFPHKDDIVFGGSEAAIDRLVARLLDGSGDLVDRLRSWVEDEGARVGDDAIERLRQRAVSTDPDLRMRARLRMEVAEEKIAAAVAADLGEPADGIGPRAFATATLGVLVGIADIYAGEAEATAVAELDRGLAFLRGGLAALRSP